MKLLDRHVAKTIITTTLFVSLVLLGIQSFLALVQQFRHIGVSQYGVLQAFLFVPMQLPAQFYQLFPMAGFLGCLIGLGRLALSSELIVMRAAGVSVPRIAWAVIKAAIPMIVIVTLLGEGVGPVWQKDATLMRQHALNATYSRTLKSIWLREGNQFTHVGEIKGRQIANITRYYFDDNDRLEKVSFAKRGVLQKQGKWVLSDVVHTMLRNDQVQTKHQLSEKVSLELKPNLQVQLASNPAEQTLLGLYHAIGYQHKVGLSANQLIYSLWQRLLQPITSLIMICLGVPFVFGSLRSASMGLTVLLGVVIGFVFYMLNQLFGPMTLVYQYPPILAAVTPTVIFALLLIILLTRVE